MLSVRLAKNSIFHSVGAVAGMCMTFVNGMGRRNSSWRNTRGLSTIFHILSYPGDTMPKSVERFLETDWVTKLLMTAFIALLTWNLKTTYDLSLTVKEIQSSSAVIDDNVERRLEGIEEDLRVIKND
jgi:hypothetical protein